MICCWLGNPSVNACCNIIAGVNRNDLCRLHQVGAAQKTRVILLHSRRPLHSKFHLLPSSFYLPGGDTNRNVMSYIPSAIGFLNQIWPGLLRAVDVTPRPLVHLIFFRCFLSAVTMALTCALDCSFYSPLYSLPLFTAVYEPNCPWGRVKIYPMMQQDAASCTKRNSIIPHINTSSGEPLFQRHKPFFSFN